MFHTGLLDLLLPPQLRWPGRPALVRRVRVTLICLLVVILCHAWSAPVEAAFPGNNGSIVFENLGPCNEGGCFSYIYALDSRGRPRELVDPDDDFQDPAFSADGGRLALIGPSAQYTHFDGFGFRPYVLRGPGFGPAWSPSGRSLVYMRGSIPDGTERIVMRRIGGGRSQRLTRGSDPTWSIRDQIAFVREAPGVSDRLDGDLYRMSGSGGDVGQLTRGLADDRRPDWAPNGRSLAFQRTAAGHPGVFVLDLRTRTIHRLANDAESPAWSPDARRLLFVRNGELWIMDASGAHEHRLVRRREAHSDSVAATWQPLPPATSKAGPALARTGHQLWPQLGLGAALLASGARFLLPLFVRKRYRSDCARSHLNARSGRRLRAPR